MGSLSQDAVAFLAGGQSFLGPLAFGDIPAKRDNHFAFLRLDNIGIDFYRDDFPIRVLVIDFKILYGTIFETIDNFIPVSFKIVRSSPIHHLPAKDFLHGRVPAEMGIIQICINYPALFIHHHIAGIGGFNYCPVSFFAFAQCFFRQLTFA